MLPAFTPWPKTPRLFRDAIVTEKIDGTNAAVGITEDGDVYAQSRKRLITPEADNFGFAAWVQEHGAALQATLGPGLHFGEWWGSGIQRGYGLTNGDKRFSLFHIDRWEDGDLSAVPGLGTVPVLVRSIFSSGIVDNALAYLRKYGSQAAPGFMRPEGVVVFHVAARQGFKVLLENDDQPKSGVNSRFSEPERYRVDL